MELDHIAYIDIVHICAVILAPGKPLNGALCTAPHALASFMHRGGRGRNRHSGTLQQTWRKQQRLRSVRRRVSWLVKEKAVVQSFGDGFGYKSSDEQQNTLYVWSTISTLQPVEALRIFFTT